MSVTPIRLFGDPLLRSRAEEVVDFDRQLALLIRDLTDTMLQAAGAGLAAPQIGVGLRAFTYHVDGQVGHLVNPVIEPVGEEEDDAEEGCLSIPGLYFPCRRRLHIIARGVDLHGEPDEIAGSDMLARAILHETDHLDGVLFIDRLDPDTRRVALAALRAAEWADQPTPAVKVSPHPVFGSVR
ncbi:peptide deformylase [soil metagenome]